MPAPSATIEQYREQQARAVATELEVANLWSRMGENFEASWRVIGEQVAELVRFSQLEAAKSARDYLPAVLEQTDQLLDDRWAIVPETLAETASDGRPLESLMYQSVVKAGTAYNAGANTVEALRIGEQFLRLATVAQVQDAGRVATGVGVATNRFVHGYVRFLNPPSCRRCAVLAGREYRYSTGFLRHPRCDCIMVPAKNAAWAEAEGFIWDATANLDLIKDLTEAERSAIEAGADISQVINATRNMSVAGLTTLEGTSARGVFGRSQIAAGSDIRRGAARKQGAVQNFRQSSTTQVRLTPEGIYKMARTDAEVIDLLQQNGYITRPRTRGTIPTRSATSSGAGGSGGGRPSGPVGSGGMDDERQAAAERVMAAAIAAEPAATKLVTLGAEIGRGEVVREATRFKTEESVLEKLERFRRSGPNPFDQAEARFNDALRYTVVFEDDDYWNSANNMVDALGALGFRVEPVQMGWRTTGYRGINVTVLDPNGRQFEVQLHTAASLAASEDTHDWYEEARKLRRNDPARVALEALIKARYGQVPRPRGVPEVP